MLKKYFCADGGLLPFRFIYGGKNSEDFLPEWDKSAEKMPGQGSETIRAVFARDGEALKVTAEAVVYAGYPAMDCKLYMENTGSADTGVIEKIDSLFLRFDPPAGGEYVLHKAMGGLCHAGDFEQADITIAQGQSVRLETAGGRSTNKDNAYFTLDTGKQRVIFAVGWSGQWRCDFTYGAQGMVVTAGLEDCHFTLRPGEKVALPSMLVLFWEGDQDYAYSAFRALIRDCYLPQLPNRDKRPYLFCNTAFTRGGMWLNECNEGNQISLIRALKPLDVENVITDAGWFAGGWPDGAGNWDPDPEKYPGGMGPVAAAAAEYGMRYGLWFELERVCAGTQFVTEYPELVLHDNIGPRRRLGNMIADLGNPKTVDILYGIVDKLLAIDNFSCYRQDFNADPLNCWRSTDTPDRAGVSEIKYINGLYDFLDRIRNNHPNVFMDGCSSGGRRLDIEMVKRFHTNQKTDLWFDPTVDQNSLFSLSHYLPCTAFTAHVNNYDDISFTSAMAATLCLGWIADSNYTEYTDIPVGAQQYKKIPPFEFTRARELIDRYQKVRLCLNDGFFPLTPPDGGPAALIAGEYIDMAAQKGVVFVFKRKENTARSIMLKFKALDENARYRVQELITGAQTEAIGAALTAGYEIGLPGAPDCRAVYFERV